MSAVRDAMRAGAFWLALIAAMLLGLAYYLGYQDGRDGQPSCPTEDSCSVDYRDGAWDIVEVTP